MKTHAKETPRKGLWKVWVTDDNYDTFSTEMESQNCPLHFEILQLFDALPTLFQKE